MMMEGNEHGQENVTKMKELFHKINPTLLEYKPYEICLVCMGIIVDLVNRAPIDEREELQSDIVSMMDTKINLPSEPKTNNNTTGWDVCTSLLNRVSNTGGTISLFDELKPILCKSTPADVHLLCTALTSGIIYEITKTGGREKLMADTIGQICAGVHLQDAGKP